MNDKGHAGDSEYDAVVLTSGLGHTYRADRQAHLAADKHTTNILVLSALILMNVTGHANDR